MIDKLGFCRILSEWLATKELQFDNAIYNVDRSHWWQGYDIFATYEALEAKIRYDTFGQLASELHEILSLFGYEIPNSTK